MPAFVDTLKLTRHNNSIQLKSTFLDPQASRQGASHLSCTLDRISRHGRRPWRILKFVGKFV